MSSSRRKAQRNPPKRNDSSIDRAGPIAGDFTMNMGYRIHNYSTQERIAHGQVVTNNDWVDVSFLLCDSNKDQENIYRNLTSIQHPSVVRVFLRLPEIVRLGGEDFYPIAIERVSSTLNAFFEKHKKNIWQHGNLNGTFQQIARDTIDGMTFIHGMNKVHGRKSEIGIRTLDLVMVGDKVKFAFVYADNKMHRASGDLDELKRLDGKDLMKLFEVILRDPNKNPDWKHFMEQNFAHKLRFQPMLLDTSMKFLLPVNTKIFLVDVSGEGASSQVNVSSIGKRFNDLRKEKDEKGVKELEKAKPWSSNIPPGKLLDICNYRKYDPYCAYSRYKYIRNVCVHYPRDKEFSPGIVVSELNKNFPGYLCDIYDVFDKDYLARCSKPTMQVMDLRELGDLS